jgi:pilus assembly protein Flp/PilA
MQLIRRFLTDRRGATAIEYGLIAALMSLAILAGMGQVANAVSAMFGDQDRELQKAFSRY